MDRDRPHAVSTAWTSQAAFWLVLGAWMAASLLARGVDPDVYWHLSVGAAWWRGAPPGLDALSWTVPGRYWLDHEWLGEAAWAWWYARGGMAAIAWLNWAGLLALLGMLTVLTRRAGCSPVAALAGAASATLVLTPWYAPRLQLMAGLGLALTLLHLQVWDTGRARGWLALTFAALVVVWANVHGGSAAVGPGTAAVALASEAMARRPWVELRWLALMVAAGSLALLVNPAGAGLPLFALATLLDPRIAAMNRIVQEWHPFDLALPVARVFAAWVLGLAVVLLAGRRLGPAALVGPAVVWLVMGFSALRHMPLAAIASLPLLGTALWALEQQGRGKLAGALVAAMGLAMLALHPLVRWPSPGLIAYGMPSGPAMAALHRVGPGHHLLNQYSWGGLIGFADPAIKVFIDGRQYVFGPAINADYQAMAMARPGLRAMLARYGVDVVFFSRDWPLPRALDHEPGWRRMYEDPTAVLYTRRSAREDSP